MLTHFPVRNAGLPLILVAAVAACALSASARAPRPAKQRPRVEVVFCLDTTGSMGGLLEGAKQKIWAISNQIASGKPTPQLKVGLVAFRDRGDAYVTQVFDLTEDLDAIHGHLKEFKAEGGGDTPESVNEALHVAVNQVKWSTDARTMRLLFLVGDAPPHMDYPDDAKYPATCKEACLKGIIINTIQCGNDADTTRFWKEICQKAEGKFVQIPQDGGVVAVATPFDNRLAEINAELARSTLTYGDAANQAAGAAVMRCAPCLPAAAAADRAAYGAKNGMTSSCDMLDNINAGKVKLEELKTEELPVELQKMNRQQQQAHLDKLAKHRAGLQKEVLELDRKRSAFMAGKLAQSKEKSSFDQQVLAILRTQAKKYQVDY
jgi:Mg-chelatase subunit ChlD